MELVQIYKVVKRALIEISYRKHGLDTEYLMNPNELKEYMKMENLMDLSYFFFQYYSLGEHSILQQMEDILDRQLVTDDSDIEDVIIYHHAYYFLHFTQMPEYYEELIEKLCQMGSNYVSYIQSKEEFDTLLILQGEFDISF